MGSDNEKIISFPGTPAIDAALQFRVELLLMPYPVWRRLLVPPTFTFWDLHVAIQDAMGWQDKHLHRFTIDGPEFGQRVRFGIPDPSGFHGVHEIIPGWEHTVDGFFRPASSPALYTYDFGDNWQHEIFLEEYVPGHSAADLPICMAGEGACPPEDCGGPHACDSPSAPGELLNFDPGAVTFDNPRERWIRSFGHD
jgi:hypothetical protein